MIVDQRGGRRIIVRRRHPETNERIVEKINDIHPFGYVLTGDSYKIDALAKETGYYGVYGEDLTKVVMSNPKEVGQLKHRGMQTWECNIPFSNRVLSERMITKGLEPYPNYNHRICYLDMEWMWDSGTITVITVCDSYRPDFLYTWVLDPEQKMSAPHMKKFKDERSLLSDFIKFFREKDFDVITGWNVVNADIQQLIGRMQKNQLDPKKLSPNNFIRYDYGDWDQPISGINTIDLMVSFCRLWEIKNGKLPNKKLDTVAW